MASRTSVSQLYAAIGQLAYTESQMATMPLSPFVRTDVPRLTDQSTSLATLAANIHARDPNEMSQDDVDSASAHVLAAQTPFDVINDTNNNRLDSGPVFALVDSAIEAIRAI